MIKMEKARVYFEHASYTRPYFNEYAPFRRHTYYIVVIICRWRSLTQAHTIAIYQMTIKWKMFQFISLSAVRHYRL